MLSIRSTLNYLQLSSLRKGVLSYGTGIADFHQSTRRSYRSVFAGDAMGTVKAIEHDTVASQDKETCCIFQQPWWLEAVAPGAWGEVTINKSGVTVARLPFVLKKKFGLTVLSVPPLTCRLGPWLCLHEMKYSQRLADEKELMTKLIGQLPRFDLFRQNFTPEITNWLPFYWAGFEQTTNYTYRLEDLTDLDAVWEGFRHSARSEIRKAENEVKVRTDLGVDRFLEMNVKTFARQGCQLPYTPDLVHRIDAACERNNCRRIFFAEDARGNTHAALYVVWDKRFLFTIMGGSDPTLRNSGAGSLLFWRAIQFAAKQGKAFDFEGSMIEPVERHFRNYGARQVPYFRVWKMSRRMKALNAGLEFWQALRGQ